VDQALECPDRRYRPTRFIGTQRRGRCATQFRQPPTGKARSGPHFFQDESGIHGVIVPDLVSYRSMNCSFSERSGARIAGTAPDRTSEVASNCSDSRLPGTTPAPTLSSETESARSAGCGLEILRQQVRCRSERRSVLREAAFSETDAAWLRWPTGTALVGVRRLRGGPSDSKRWTGPTPSR
jgi:hypothetical protein